MAARDSKGNGKGRPIIIRREEGAAAGHHGGAWKVAYADFVTAMMAFFLVMWLINATTEDQRKGLADYFSPTNLMSHNSSGTGKPFGGETAFSNGAMVSDKGAVEVTVGLHPVLDNPIPRRHPPAPTAPHGGRGAGHQGTDQHRGHGAVAGGTVAGGVARPMPPAAPGGATRQGGPGAAASQAGVPIRLPSGPQAGPRPFAPASGAGTGGQEVAFRAARATIEHLVHADPMLAAIAAQLAIDITPRGLRIQLLDSRRNAMFAAGSARPNAAARRALRLIGPILAKLAGPVRIAGFTDSSLPPGGAAGGNWALSAARANATRATLAAAGLADSRIAAVTGHGSHDLLLPADPNAAANRRISILVLRRPEPPGPATPPGTTSGATSGAAPRGTPLDTASGGT